MLLGTFRTVLTNNVYRIFFSERIDIFSLNVFRFYIKLLYQLMH